MNILSIDASCSTKVAKAIQDTWAYTSDDSGDWQDALQKNAYDETPDAANRLSEPDGIKELFNDYINTDDVRFNARSEGHWEIAEAASASIYDRTQNYLRSKGIEPNDTLTLYRGMMVDKSTLDQFESGDDLFIKPRPLSSFALDYRTAYSFGHGSGEYWDPVTNKHIKQEGAVFAVKVPAKSLFSHWATGFGCAGENEVVVKGDYLADSPWFLVSKGSRTAKALQFSTKAKRPVPATPDIVEDRNNADWLIRLQEQASDEEGRPTDLELSYGEEVKGGAGSGNFGHAGRPGARGGSAGGGASGLTSKYVQGRELTPEDAPEVAAFFSDQNWSGSFGDDDKNITNDVGLSKILKAQGFDGKPELVSKEELDTLVEQGYTEMYRGVATDAYAEQFRTGELYISAGSFGNGTYASTNLKTAKDYAGYDYQSDVYAKPIRMALRPEAKVLDYGNDVFRIGGLAHRFQMDSPERDRLYEQAKLAHKAGDTAKGDKLLQQRNALVNQDQARHRLGYDVGRMAAFLGYDAIRIQQGGSFNVSDRIEDFYVILNRTALVVER